MYEKLMEICRCAGCHCRLCGAHRPVWRQIPGQVAEAADRCCHGGCSCGEKLADAACEAGEAVEEAVEHVAEGAEEVLENVEQAAEEAVEAPQEAVTEEDFAD